MLGWLDFFIVLFWVSLGLFFFNINNFVTILLYAELTWLVLYTLSTIVGAAVNDITSMSLTFFILGFGGLEFVIGLMLVVLMKNMNVDLLSENNKNVLNSTTTGNLNNKKWNL